MLQRKVLPRPGLTGEQAMRLTVPELKLILEKKASLFPSCSVTLELIRCL
jgi:hypothetical protein